MSRFNRVDFVRSAEVKCRRWQIKLSNLNPEADEKKTLKTDLNLF